MAQRGINERRTDAAAAKLLEHFDIITHDNILAIE